MKDKKNKIPYVLTSSVIFLLLAIMCFYVPYYGTYLFYKKADKSDHWNCSLIIGSLLTYTADAILLIVSFNRHHDISCYWINPIILIIFGIFGLFISIIIDIIYQAMTGDTSDDSWDSW